MIAAMHLWAVHINDGPLTVVWWAGGFGAAALLVLWGAWRIREEEIPRIALMTAAFFVASLIHVPLGVSSAHLLLNGLLGVVLGRRASLAILVGLFLQAVLFRHGGFTTLGINTCILTLPAYIAWGLFAALERVPWIRQAWFRGVAVALCALGWVLCLVYGLALLFVDNLAQLPAMVHGAAVAGGLVVAGIAVWAEHRLRNHPEFPLGLLVGQVTVLATILLQSLVLLLGAQKPPEGDRLLYYGERLGLVKAEPKPEAENATPSSDRQPWRVIALILFLVHLPLAVMEGTVLGFTVGFLARVRPGMLGWPAQEKPQCPVDSRP